MANIAIFLPDAGGGGAERMMVNLANHFAAEGHETAVVLATAEGPWRDHLRHPVRTFNLGTSFTNPAVIGRLASALRTLSPEAVLTAMTYPNVATILARGLSRVRTRLVISERVALSVQSQSLGSVKERLKPAAARLLYRHADAIVAISRGVADDLVRNAGVRPRDLRVIYNPVLTDDFTAPDQPPQHPWYRDRQTPIIVAAGRLQPQKNFSLLLKAFSIASARTDARLVVLGEGPERSSLEEQARSLGIADKVSLPGFVHDIYRYYAFADGFVLASDWEGFGNVLVEAMACGCPVTSTDCPSGPREILDNGRFGILVPPGDPDAMAEGILAMLGSSPAKAMLQARAREFSVGAKAREYLDVLLARQEPPRTP